jgi:hypothetical protein
MFADHGTKLQQIAPISERGGIVPPNDGLRENLTIYKIVYEKK